MIITCLIYLFEYLWPTDRVVSLQKKSYAHHTTHCNHFFRCTYKVKQKKKNQGFQIFVRYCKLNSQKNIYSKV